MSLIRLQDKVPYVYVDKSRDFQVLCRAYDTALNQVKFDIDTIPYILSSSECRNSILPLLQTKLGFQTLKHIDSDSLRIILSAFPDAVRYKGSLLGIQRAINAWLKIIHLETKVYVDVFNVFDKSNPSIGGYIGQTMIPAYTIAIGVGGNPRDYSILQEILKYIVPTGYGLYFYFFREFSTEQTPTLNLTDEKATLVFISDDVNSAVRSSDGDEVQHNPLSITQAEQITKGRVVTTPFSVEAIGSDIEVSDLVDVKYINTTPTYTVEVTNTGSSATINIPTNNIDFEDGASFDSLTIEWGTEDVN